MDFASDFENVSETFCVEVIHSLGYGLCNRYALKARKEYWEDTCIKYLHYVMVLSDALANVVYSKIACCNT